MLVWRVIKSAVTEVCCMPVLPEVYVHIRADSMLLPRCSCNILVMQISIGSFY